MCTHATPQSAALSAARSRSVPLDAAGSESFLSICVFGHNSNRTTSLASVIKEFWKKSVKNHRSNLVSFSESDLAENSIFRLVFCWLYALA